MTSEKKSKKAAKSKGKGSAPKSGKQSPLSEESEPSSKSLTPTLPPLGESAKATREAATAAGKTIEATKRGPGRPKSKAKQKREEEAAKEAEKAARSAKNMARVQEIIQERFLGKSVLLPSYVLAARYGRHWLFSKQEQAEIEELMRIFAEERLDLDLAAPWMIDVLLIMTLISGYGIRGYQQWQLNRKARQEAEQQGTVEDGQPDNAHPDSRVGGHGEVNTGAETPATVPA